MTERAGRIVAPAAVALFVVLGVLQSEQSAAVAVTAGLVAVAVSVGLKLRSVEGWPLVAGLAVAAAAITVVCNASPSNLGWFGVCVLVGWCVLVAPTAQAVAFACGVLAILGIQLATVNDDAGGGAWIAGTAFTAVVCAVARRQRDLLDQLRAAQAGLAESTRAEERNRIAGEMHDVIGHALTVSLLHVSSARLALDEDLAEARASLAEAERLGRQSLLEVRQAVGMLREQRTSNVAPMPGASQLPGLVESFRRAGCEVHLEIEGDLDALTTTVGLTVYRIAQEALTNVVRHAPAATTWVRLVVSPHGTRLTVDDDGGTAVVRQDEPGGVGILNMRERAEAVGGRLSAGPAGIGWRVEADLPSPALERS